MSRLLHGLLLVSLLSVSVCQAADTPGLAGFRLSVHGGLVAADIGGDTKTGLAVGFVIVPDRKRNAGPLSMRFGAEYNQKRGHGQVWDSNLDDGSLLYAGPGGVTLHYLQTSIGGQYHLQFGNVEFSPHVGVAPAFLITQTIKPDTPPQDGAFDGFSWYRSVDVLGLVGFEVLYRRLVLDVQFSYGFLTLNQSQTGTSALGTPFTAQGEHSKSLRLGLGLSF